MTAAASSQHGGDDVAKGRTSIHLSLDLSEKKEKIHLDLSPDEFYKLSLELEKAKYQLEALFKGSSRSDDSIKDTM